ncbi:MULTISPECIES: hypothetical protein [Achromobacter]|uniref:Lipoprotein n=1 Tax=Achromobacter aegrifaciens TaxID=1287736 RepID=A0ABU2DA95_ACHAE|nr:MULTISPECIES: hypothetical protein [Achromobacter]MBD9476139.1 hypothetical protein [Achromobacter sp. ACM01]MDR7945021.1 hypothetical protein [Achromobacter aegrifaciens]CAB3867018.1 hypothetical protein LMG26854_03778 [Achromobacter aegrifaciens]CAB3926934.1 hypothetical protein LMG3410_06070 [Achromobacter aegrifaciens]
MKKLLCIVLIFLSGCAVKQPPPKYQLDKQANQAFIQSGKSVEIFYHDDNFVVMDLGGSQAAGLLGILGPVGLLVGLSAHAAHKLDFRARTERRSEEFSKLVGENISDQSINQAFARQIGDLLAKDGREVKVTKVTRPSGSDDLAASVSEDLVPTEGHMQLLLRLTTGYAAASATDSYKPMTVIEYALKDEHGKPLMARSFNRFYGDSDKTFLTFASLIEDYKGAHGELGARLSYWSEPVYTEIFRFPDQVAAK